MSARDRFHAAVRHVLEKEGWSITYSIIHKHWHQIHECQTSVCQGKLKLALLFNRNE